jgi:hypothetical protein
MKEGEACKFVGVEGQAHKFVRVDGQAHKFVRVEGQAHKVVEMVRLESLVHRATRLVDHTCTRPL